MAMTHLGSAIWSYTSRRTGAIFCETRPATIIRSAWRGEARNSSDPKRAMSKREAPAAIISMAQQARPKVTGQIDDSRAQSSSRLRTNPGEPDLLSSLEEVIANPMHHALGHRYTPRQARRRS